MKKMKKNKYYIILIVSIFLLGSCDLDRIPETALSDANFWNNDNNFEQACNVIYTSLNGQTLFLSDVRSDFAFDMKAGPNAISSGTRITTATSDDWNSPYSFIFRANNIIEKAEEQKDNENITSIERWSGEAKFFRAYYYFYLVSRFGDVPLIIKTLDINSPELEAPRTERALVINQIYDDLDYAAANIPGFEELGSSGYGRVSKSAALAFKARVALYEGTRQKYHSYGNPSDNLTIAVNAAEAAMAEGHELFPSYFDLFQYNGEGFANKENILSIIYGVDKDNRIRQQSIDEHVWNGFANVTKPMIDLYLCTDGLPYDKSPLAAPDTSVVSTYINKDIRMDASLLKKGETFARGTAFDPASDNNINTAYCPQKFFNTEDLQIYGNLIDIPVIRYAEVLLTYAEAKFELGETISDADLDKSINLLRDRASMMPHLTNAFVSANGLDMRTEIRRERTVELAFEGHRYDDIMRWKIAEDVLPKEMIGMKYYDEFGPREVNADGYLLVQPASTKSFDPDKDYLYPIPTKEIALSGGALIQNPGWK
jgi:hypothetical protein